MRAVTLVAIVLLTLAAYSAATAGAPAPLGVNSRTIGGGNLNTYTQGVQDGVGLNNIGMLVRMWGKVTFVDAQNKFFYLDDGGRRIDGSGHLGVRVSYDDLADGRSFNPPTENWIVAVTGISSTTVISGKVQPNLMPRSGSDMIQFGP